MREGLRAHGPSRLVRLAGSTRTRRWNAALVVGAVALVSVLGMVASIVPGASAQPTGRAADPPSNLPDTFARPLDAVNAGRAQDGVARITDRGFGSLTSGEELFVLVNLERVARSLPPFEEMTSSLDGLAQIGANALQDPPLPVPPAGTSSATGTLWAGTSDPLLADFGWMYQDGCGPVVPQSFVNSDCASSPPNPWGHRNLILADFSVANAGCSLSMGVAVAAGSIAMVTEGYCGAAPPSDPVFTWEEAEVIIGLSPLPSTPPPSIAPTGSTASTGSCGAPVRSPGYRFVGSDGGVFDFGKYPFCGSTGNIQLSRPVVGMASTPDKGGYWLAAADGGIFAFGDATFYGSLGGTALSAPIVGVAAAPFGNGYWLAASDGGVFAFGSARFYGSMGGTALSAPIVGMAVAPFGLGYWLVAADGGVFAFGGAQFYGSMGGNELNKPIVGIAASPFGNGYWIVASDGGVFAFGYARYYGSTGAISLDRPIVGMAAGPLGLGYWLVAADGGVFGFGDGAFYGSTGGIALARPVVGMAA
jgi:hypothetical protein